MKQAPSAADALLLAISEASHAAHRWRDAGQAQYAAGGQTRNFARRSKRMKEAMYSLKERGIVEAHKTGVLRYAGASPQGLAVYEYGEGGLRCFHSRLHPRLAERKLVEGHPEVIFVAAKRKRARMADVIDALSVLPAPDAADYATSDPPKPNITCFRCGGRGHIARECPSNVIVCYNCGEEGHFARDCGDYQDEDEDDVDDGDGDL